MKGLYMMPYNKKVYNLELKENDLQLIAEGIIVGDFMKQNHMEDCCNRKEEPIKGQEELTAEFQILVSEINKRRKWNE